MMELPAAVSLAGTTAFPLPLEGVNMPLPMRRSAPPALEPSPAEPPHALGERVDVVPSARLVPRQSVRLIRRDFQIIKRVLDLTICLLILPLVLPVMAVCAVLVWIDNPGPIFFRQLRTGQGGRRFKMFKFRTMVTNAEELKQVYAHLNELTWPDFKISDDPRVTRVGRFLRKSSLDELPQILNVLLGDMSLVGPRPTSFAANTYALWQTERLEVLPGITGLWQISGRSDLDFDDRLRLDIEYIERQSVWLDLQILIRTATVIFSQRGAY
jgi:lipopolysaccharide/colanic/teichoic acid biosynthesis glycosyltransferase